MDDGAWARDDIILYILCLPWYVHCIECALTFASEAKFEIEAKISFLLDVKKKPDFT